MKIETERLEIVVLTASQLEKWLYDLPALEEELGCHYQAEPVEGFFKEILEGQLRKTKEEPENYMWHSFWWMIRKEDRVVVGSADFKNVPSNQGEAEIGYGLGKEFEHHGYMTETVKVMCQWGLAQTGVKHIIAETEIQNEASKRILQRCGFKQYKQGETIWWSL